jgi:hypothetical protein
MGKEDYQWFLSNRKIQHESILYFCLWPIFSYLLWYSMCFYKEAIKLAAVLIVFISLDHFQRLEKQAFKWSHGKYKWCFKITVMLLTGLQSIQGNKGFQIFNNDAKADSILSPRHCVFQHMQQTILKEYTNCLCPWPDTCYFRKLNFTFIIYKVSTNTLRNLELIKNC